MAGVISPTGDAFWVLQRHLRLTVRYPSALLLASLHPILWMALFGPLFQSVNTIDGFAEGSYYQFLAPGIAVMTAIFGASFSGFVTLSDIQSGLLDKTLATPVSRFALVAGPILNTVAQTACQAAVIVLTGVVLGARLRGGILGGVVLFVAVALLSSSFAALSHSIALLTRTQRMLVTVVNLFSMPLVFLSSMMMPHALMPSWMRAVALVNPVDWAVTASRAAFNGEFGPHILTPLALLMASSAVTCGVAVRCVHRYQRHG